MSIKPTLLVALLFTSFTVAGAEGRARTEPRAVASGCALPEELVSRSGNPLATARGSVTFALTAHAQTQQKDPPAPPAPAAKTISADQAKKDAAYEALLKKLKGGDRTVDFKELRMAYADSSGYNPYGSDSEARQAMFAALNAKQWDEALKQSAKVLEKNYVDLNAQFVAAVANHEKGVADQADFHRFIVQGLFDSITNSGDGKSADKAFVVISTDEEYALLNYFGLRPMDQALLSVGGHSYDKLTAVDPKTNEKHELYFNIDKPFGWLGNSLKH